MKPNTIDWEIKCVNMADYEVYLTMATKSAIMLKVLEKSKKELRKRSKIEVQGNIDNIKRFKIEPQFYKLLTTITAPLMRKISKECKRDGIELMNHYVSGGEFFRMDSGDWLITVTLAGQYADKR